MHASHNGPRALAGRAQLRDMNAAEQASDPVHLDPRQVAEIADRVTDEIVERLVEAIKAERSHSAGTRVGVLA